MNKLNVIDRGESPGDGKEEELMKALYSEEYYRSRWDEMLASARGEHGINLEKELADKMSAYNEALKDTPEALEILKNKVAGEIVEKATRLVVAEMEVIKNIEAGKASFGYTTQTQEVQAQAEYRKRFEFNCLQLADFKKAHEPGASRD